ncbi:TrbC/VirB2 family protein [Aquabacterium sp. CECT 9606]|uniref:TrbC/VirB2 family protein n=1 Tax=Aquabacterium sp. CECT 9606 TaxID=2845822 RepID=UPI001E5670B9|nr:TrbC/VirB2 family protein [Aquabacterium sp. CECT 9606]
MHSAHFTFKHFFNFVTRFGELQMKNTQVAALHQRTFALANKATLARVGGFVLAMAATPAFAQISKVNTVMANVQTVLVGVAVTMFTLAIMWAGFKMAFQHAKWSEISNIVIGGILVGGAAGIAAWLIN